MNNLFSTFYASYTNEIKIKKHSQMIEIIMNNLKYMFLKQNFYENWLYFSLIFFKHIILIAFTYC